MVRGVRDRRSVWLLVETSNRHGRDIISGVVDFARHRPSWTVHLSEHGRNSFGSEWLGKCVQGQVDGVIARGETFPLAEKIRRLGVPVVNISSVDMLPELVSLAADIDGIARLAADHLLECGFVHFGFCGDGRYPWSASRGDSFASYVQKAGYEVSTFVVHSDRRRHRRGEWSDMADWLAQLPKPAGVMVCYDILGRQVLDVCRDSGLRVPDEVAVIGVNNDELFCELSDPPLSSVIPDGRGLGYEAASLLEEIMNGGRFTPGIRTVPPLGVAVRRSTDVLAIEDEAVAGALRFIREHAHENILVDDVAEVSNLSRSTLERRFRRRLHCTVHDRIQKVRIERVQSLLLTTDLPLKSIAFQTGFERPEYLTVAFKRLVGICPSEYRRRRRLQGESPAGNGRDDRGSRRD